MLKRINWHIVWVTFAWLISLSGLVLLAGFVSVKQEEVVCTNVKIIIPGADNFIERDEVDLILLQNQGQLLGRKLSGINAHEIENNLTANPYIAYAKVFTDMDGTVNIEIKQRIPVLRVINYNGQDYYIDTEGLKMPISPNFTANVLVATGQISEPFANRVDTLQTNLAKDLYKTALYLSKDTLWNNQIVQIGVDAKEGIVMVPRIGEERIILGEADSLDIKMRNLKVFYKSVMPQIVAKTYKIINIKYTNQVIGERNKIDTAAISKRKVLTAKDSAYVQRMVLDSLLKAEVAKADQEMKNSSVENSGAKTGDQKNATLKNNNR